MGGLVTVSSGGITVSAGGLRVTGDTVLNANLAVTAGSTTLLDATAASLTTTNATVNGLLTAGKACDLESFTSLFVVNGLTKKNA